jgi:hypothetical protein
MGRPHLAIRGERRNHTAVRAGVIAVVLACVLCAGTADAASHRLSAFTGTGSWVSIYDSQALRHPRDVVDTLREHRIHTLFVETSNDKQSRDIAHPRALSQLLDDAHAAGIQVVGWFLPSFVRPRRDIARALAGARFTSTSGERFDAFALDIEATNVRDLARRSLRAVWVAHDVRAALPRSLALGAITIDPDGGRYWNGYPFAGLRKSVDVFLPMEYFTYRTSGARRVAAYSSANVRLVRERAGDASFPVHPIGGSAAAATLGELRAFLRASSSSDTLGVSLWEYGQTSPRQWAMLASARTR